MKKKLLHHSTGPLMPTPHGTSAGSDVGVFLHQILNGSLSLCTRTLAVGLRSMIRVIAIATKGLQKWLTGGQWYHDLSLIFCMLFLQQRLSSLTLSWHDTWHLLPPITWDLVVYVLVILATARSSLRVLCLALGAGYLTEIQSLVPQGHYMVIYSTLVLGVLVVKKHVDWNRKQSLWFTALITHTVVCTSLALVHMMISGTVLAAAATMVPHGMGVLVQGGLCWLLMSKAHSLACHMRKQSHSRESRRNTTIKMIRLKSKT